MRLFLAGFMGCGKTTVGKQLAKELNFPFFDLDEEIEKAADQSISSIFSEYGEEYFRELEAQKLRDTMLLAEDVVLALGGGTPCYYDNLWAMQSEGKIIYLQCSTDTLFERLQKEKSQRPLISDKEDEELFSSIEKYLSLREKYYQHADLIVDCNGKSVEEIVEIIKTVFL